jgi:hypothetical protein
VRLAADIDQGTWTALARIRAATADAGKARLMTLAESPHVACMIGATDSSQRNKGVDCRSTAVLGLSGRSLFVDFFGLQAG